MAEASEVEVYTGSFCPFCERAKALLRRKNVEFVEYSLDGDEVTRAKMLERSGGLRSVPQIFIHGQHVGGCDDLHALEASGKLDPLLKSR